MTVAELKEALKYADDEATVSVCISVVDYRIEKGHFEHKKIVSTVWQFPNEVVIRT